MSLPADPEATGFSLPSLRETEPGTFVLSGVLAFGTVGVARREGARMFDRSGAAVVDLKGVTHTDSAGLTLLIHWLRTARRRAVDITFRNIPAQMWALARVCGVDGIIRDRAEGAP